MPDQLATWPGRDVVILFPLYQGIHPWTHYTLFANYARYGPEKLGMICEMGTQVHETRNRLVAKARKTSANWFITTDSDMVVPCGSPDFFHGNLRCPIPEPGVSMVGISRLMSHPVDHLVVGSLYFGRHEFGAAQCASGFSLNKDRDNDLFRSHKLTALRAEDWVAPGFMRIHRSVFDLLDKAIDAGEFPECIPNGVGRARGYFNPIKAGMGEDVSFGLRCKKIGIQSYIDPVLECLHGDGPCSHYGSHNTRNDNRILTPQ